jgi:hypothetical protein
MTQFTVVKFECRDRLGFLSSQQKAKLNRKFRSPNKKVMPHELAVSLGIELSQAYAIIIALGSAGLSENRLLIYHTCTDVEVGSIPFGIGFPPLPWNCPECGKVIEDRDEMSFDLMAIVSNPIEFI